jgi:hypothetical protein
MQTKHKTAGAFIDPEIPLYGDPARASESHCQTDCMEKLCPVWLDYWPTCPKCGRKMYLYRVFELVDVAQVGDD